jgi:hypothetical protein
MRVPDLIELPHLLVVEFELLRDTVEHPTETAASSATPRFALITPTLASGPALYLWAAILLPGDLGRTCGRHHGHDKRRD